MALNAEQRDYLPDERRNMILNLLTQHEVVTVTQLATSLETTEITVRRDLNALARAGLLKRIRGGAMSIGTIKEPAPAGNAAIPEPDTPENTSIGVMVPEPSFFWPGIVNHMKHIAAESGISLTIRTCSYDENMHEERILQELADAPRVCGIIAAPNSHPHLGQHAWQWIETTTIPTVVLEREQPLLTTRYVDSIAAAYVKRYPIFLRMDIHTSAQPSVKLPHQPSFSEAGRILSNKHRGSNARLS